MSSIPDPSSSSGRTPSLKAGLTALKQGDYQTAISHLEGVCETELYELSIVRAQMGLVTAYERTGKLQSAFELCQTLSRHSNAQVKEWAQKTLAQLQSRYPQGVSQTATPSEGTGFMPLESKPQPANPSGFMPLESENQTVNPTGFIPLESEPQRLQKKQQRSTPKEEAGFIAFPPVTPQKPSTSAKSQPPTDSPPAQLSTSQPEEIEELEPILSSEAVLEEIVEVPPPQAEAETYQPQWRNAGRANNWKPLKAIKTNKLWGLQIITVVLLFGLIHTAIHWKMAAINNILVKLPYLWPIQAFYQDYTQPILFTLLGLFIFSPWLLDAILKFFYGQKPLSMNQLSESSPEAAKLVKRICWKQKWPIPSLYLLPVSEPVILTYGNLPRTARITVSQGLLEQLSDDEIATLYAGELGHIVHWDFALMSLAVLVLQLPYVVYWQMAYWNEQGQRQISAPFLATALGGTMAVISAVAYGTYWLFRWPALWLSRQRVYYSDRHAVQLTGNPNGLTRALLKSAIGIAQDVQKIQRTSYVLEGFELLVPVGYRQALTLGSCYQISPLEPILEWDCANPYQPWLVINNSHPPLGDRLYVLAQYARFWKLDTELDLVAPAAKSKSQSSLQPLLLQGSPYFGALFGLVIAGVFWLTGWVGVTFKIRLLMWIWRDFNWLLAGAVMTGFSLGTILRINRFFPDIKPANTQRDPDLPPLLSDPQALPSDSEPVRLSGKLLGRKGIGNWLGQDLILQTSTGLVKLHYLSKWGPVGNLWPKPVRPSDLVSQTVTVSGWFRRGATPWIDLETLSTSAGKTSHSGHPIWSTLAAMVAALWAAYLISRGGL
jgi:Zn-dependent protease with chaperone function